MDQSELLSKDEILARVSELFASLLNWAEVNLFTYDSLIQIGVIATLYLTSVLICSRLKPFMHKLFEEKRIYQKTEVFLKALYLPVIWWLFTFTAWQVTETLGYPIILLRMASSLIAVWVVITLVTEMIESEAISKIIRVTAWTMAILNIFGLLVPFIDFLGGTTFTVGGNTLNLLGIITGAISLVVLLWSAVFLSNFIEGKLKEAPNVTPSARVLLSKVSRIVLVVLAFLFAMSSMGIDLTALAVFGGAIGVGLGFGLQKVVSNFISGVILLVDKSIKPGDVIEISGTYGRINKLAARYTSVISRDGREHLVPNEDIITQPVINWTFSNKRVRRHLPVNVSYDSDIEHAMQLMMDAATETTRVIKNPAPRVLIKSFGDNGIDLELRMWIRDSENGVSNIASDVYLLIWKKFNEEGIEFPFPQRDIRIVSMPDGKTDFKE
ncbi:mechanosensitive ion channel family protein [Pseudemcibacter aquimaris]|uniref:mechanosensitive ion channel family protein n=1 Tax=Pseudemcibacter aquimaris TaxID=2857064 RepID=UPI0020132410|nr:mechanosensitive ion channel domain-containing protein [Pseudemcibacter aquimaris]MCC3862298.1 mechanosensitive ion channel [Pseudemcibacter aquimaris]WDU59046.1 mechanosensitive ion channel [Pseudemcibacter aquimaris]